MLRVFSCLSLFFLCTFADLLHAQSRSEDSFVIDEASADKQEKSGGELRRYCQKSDYRECSDECRKYFDGAYHDCHQTCVERRCVERQDSSKDDKASRKADTSDDSKFCVELESSPCVESCVGERDKTSRLRCRRQCLIGKCPNALRSDTSREAMNPGTIACEKCKKEVEDLCKQSCLGGMAAGKSSFSGLVGFGCNIACAKTQCASKCPVIDLP